MKNSRPVIAFVFAPLLILHALFLAGCPTTARTPQATMFAAIQAAGAGIDSFRADYESAYRAGDLDSAGLLKLDNAYNQANDAIIAATRALDAGTLASTGDIDHAVEALLKLIVDLVPARYRVNSSKWNL